MAKKEPIAKTLLDVPVGFVKQTISEFIKKTVYPKVVKQNSVLGIKYVRKVVIFHSQFTIPCAVAKFDSKNLSSSSNY